MRRPPMELPESVLRALARADRPRRIREDRYARRHQGKSERERRLRQVRCGQLSGKGFVTENARYAAHGLIGPKDSLVIHSIEG